MNLTEEPEIVQWAETHYVFVEKTGPFMSIAPQAWQELIANLPGIAAKNEISQRMSLYRRGANIYRAGVSLASSPVELPAALKYEKFHGGKFSRFVLTGPYSDLPQASGRVWQLAGERQINVREDFAIEHYVSDPSTTPEAELITEILVPTA
jgi:effector-binding domain-containing protein